MEKKQEGNLFQGEQESTTAAAPATAKKETNIKQAVQEVKKSATAEKPVQKKAVEKKPVETTAEATKKAVARKTEPKRTETAVASIATINKMSMPRLIRESKAKFLIAMVGSAATKDEIKGAVKAFDREASFAIQAFSNNAYLETCAKNDRIAVMNAVINVAQTGLTLNPVLKLGYLIPMDKKVQFWPSYMGKREIVMRTGLVKDAYARLVYASDVFEIKYGTGGYIKHVPDPWKKQKPEDLKGGYWFCLLKDGTEKFGTMNETEIKAIQKRSPSVNASHSPWKTDWEQMALKTIFNRGFKEMPKSGISEDQLKALEIADKPEEETMKSWIKSIQTKQDNFDDDTEEQEYIQDVEEV